MKNIYRFLKNTKVGFFIYLMVLSVCADLVPICFFNHLHFEFLFLGNLIMAIPLSTINKLNWLKP